MILLASGLAILDEWGSNSSYETRVNNIRTGAGSLGGIKLDADGNAVGGIRAPEIEVPLGTYLPTNSGPGFCFLYGGFDPFSESKLQQRYRNHGSYVSKMVRAVKRSKKEGFLLKEESAALRRMAARSDVGK